MPHHSALSDVGVFVFDLEGVLVENMPYEWLLDRVSKITGTSLRVLLDYYHEKWQGLDKAQEYHVSLTQSRTRRAEILGLYEEFGRKKASPEICPGAVELLQFIRDRLERPRVCWTRGNAEFQNQVLTKSGLARLFDRIVISGEKNADVFVSRVLPVLQGRTFAMIGDMFSADMVSVEGLARCRVWVAGSRANRYIEPPAEIPPDIIRVESIADLYQLLV
jgi:FMN phosphatase YigB (HAD superfamily)